MSKRKRLKDSLELHSLLCHLGEGQNASYRSNKFSDDYLEFVPDVVVQPLGRIPGHNLSEHQETQLSEILEAFDAGVLNSLSQRQRECFVDVIISGDSYQDVADRYNISRSSVQGYIKLAASHIRHFIEENYGV